MILAKGWIVFHITFLEGQEYHFFIFFQGCAVYAFKKELLYYIKIIKELLYYVKFILQLALSLSWF